MFVYCIGRCDDDKEIVFNIFSELRYFPKTQGRNLLLQLLKRGLKPRRLFPKLLMKPPENKLNYRVENCLMMWPAKKPSPAPTMAPSKLAFPVKNNGADNICCEQRRSTRVGINMLLVLDHELNSSVPSPGLSFIFRYLGGISRILSSHWTMWTFFICMAT